MCYIANVGDSRAVISKYGGKVSQPLTNDHKPSDDAELKRILEAGGKVYQ
jgi:protein phosphatase 2C family protein 2/3